MWASPRLGRAQFWNFLKGIAALLLLGLIYTDFRTSDEGGKVDQTVGPLTSLRGVDVGGAVLSKRKVAVVYARVTFHEEVVSAVACALKEQGFFVVAYIGSGFNYKKISIPFSGARQRSSYDFYGTCVHQWVTITDPYPKGSFVKSPDLAIFTTYPFTRYGGTDPGALGLLENFKQQGGKTNVLLLTHRTNETLHESLRDVEKFVPRHKLTFLFLAEHTEKFASSLIQSNDYKVVHIDVETPVWAYQSAAKDRQAYRVAHFLPIIPLKHIGMTRLLPWFQLSDRRVNVNNDLLYRKTNTAREQRVRNEQHQIFSVQGNFGGRHARRKDLKGTVTCLNNLLIQHKAGATASLHLIGHVSGAVDPGKLTGSGEVKFKSDLSSTDYYAALAQTDFLIGAITDPDYQCCRATSSVPAALIAGVPLVTNRQFLALYPCLFNSRIHNKIAQNSECASVENAMNLSKEEYALAQEEVKNCSASYFRDAKRLFSLLSEPLP